ncbi:dihydrolipoyl dehydrogenase family protein [Eupransor demetentiae]|uniref:Dihydrolipoamide dehydrogenase (E3) component of pyruvate/2-oxoglutarate dehydrogenase complex or glutathione oxidoreductase (Lpd) n=1 Tax=Eupransor demetentiae TaxID=3109584 RepID=A0ABP0EQH9_9LACO|nr:Dihydrolipoamide dehydrogenase (E3) component of pyruvate/2-oxoglutarate dehydrogenase complex or glutathione oxidoreductase (Lpd) [Lactobacillaceae bacterium LMG 33000]
MTNYDYDVLYLGSGHAAFDGAPLLTAQGKKVAFVEKEKVGGTCPNWGCNAKILLEAPVEVQRQIRASDGVIAGDGSIDWSKNQAHKRSVIDGLPNALQGMLEDAGVEYLFGDGKFLDPHTIQVGDKTVTADKVVIATGMHSHRLDIEGKELMHDSRDFLALAKMPESMVVIGSGYIAMESASMAHAAGADVTVIMRGDQALKSFSKEYSDRLVAKMEADGIEFKKATQTESVQQKSDGLLVKTNHGDIQTKWVLDATGRVPNTEGIGLDEIGVAYDEHGIQVNDHLQTSIDNIYAAGDVLAKKQPKLTPTATFESQYLAGLFNGDDKAIDYPAIATTVFTSPRIAQAGVTVAEAKAHPDDYKIVEKDVMGDWYRLVDYETEGSITLIYNQQQQLVGATEISEHAEDVINALLPAIEFGYTPAQLQRLVTIFPSIGYSAFGELG